MADIKLLLVEDDENLAYMEKNCRQWQARTGGMENLSARCHRFGYRHAYHGRSGDGEENT